MKDNIDLRKRIALEILYHSLINTESSFLYKEIVKDGLAYNLYGFLTHYNGVSLIVLGAFSSNQEKILQKLSSLTKNFSKIFDKKAFDLFKESYLNRIETDIATGDIVDFLANEIAVFGNYYKPNEILNYISKIKREDIERVYFEIIKNGSWLFFYYKD